MQLSLAYLARKGRTMLVVVKSTASNHYMTMFRDKSAEKYEFIRFDPYIERSVVYKEVKKLKTIDKPEGGKD